MEKTKRVKIVIGLKCNIQCVFCYYRDNLRTPNRSFDDVKRDLLFAKNHGIREIDFSGGEPTIHPDLPRMISEAKSMNFERVCIITNGLRLADRNYLKTLKHAGLDEILFSVHGSTPSIHDQITNAPGSFIKISEALSHAAEEQLTIRTNTVVNRLNYEDLKNIGSFVHTFKPIQVNFITINDWCFAKHIVDKLMAPYAEMAGKLKEACDSLEGLVKHINVRYIPFCFMNGYERFVCNHKQASYDPFEWVPHVRARLEVQNNLWRYLGIVGYGFIFGGIYKKMFRVSGAELLDESVTEALRSWYYTKHKNCKKCAFDPICDGVEKTYARKFGSLELSAQESAKIFDPIFFRQLR